jgi:ribonucleoside-diphosphate reductase alpha chain
MITKLHPNSEQILKSRYYTDEKEDWPALCSRVTDNVVPVSCSKYAYADEEIEDLSKQLFEMINGLYFLPNSPTMFNAGTQYPMLSACFIIDAEDSLKSIYNSVGESAQIHKMGGGVGLSFSKLRVRGSRIGTTHGVSSGAVSFVRVFSKGTDEITAGGRREGANMGVLDINHGDILEFISCKEKEGELSNFNISVAITDKFIDAVNKDEDFDLIDPKDNTVCNTVNARELMSKIVKGAWLNGEPGICFIDTVNKDNPTPHLGRIMSPNPCQPGWATLLTPDGITTFDSVEVGDIVWSGKRWTKVVNKTNSGVKDVYAYRTRAGVFYGTPNHRVVQNGTKVEVDDAVGIDVCVGPDVVEIGNANEAIMDGLVLGDGMYHKASDNVVLIVGDNDGAYFDDPDINGLFVESAFGIRPKSWKVKTSFKALPLTYIREVPDRYRFGTAVEKYGFLKGLYSANGSVVHKRVTLKASSEKVIEAVQEMLSSIGISSYYTTNREHDVEFGNGVYTCRESYDLNIGNLEGRTLFKDLIGFIQPYKMEKLESICEPNKSYTKPKTTYDIVDKEYISTEPVYDITVDADEHTYWTGGLLVSNCGEFYSIPYNSCNLGSINLTKYVNNKEIDWDLLKTHIQNAVLYLDSIIDANMYPLERISKVVKATRPVGLGVLGFADMLIMLGVKYDSDDGIALAKKISEFFSFYSLEASVKLAKKRGSYPEFRPENHQYKKYIQEGTLDWKGLVGRIKKEGLRNSHTIVIAPTGTLARIANQCSFGIEPVFALSFESNILNAKQSTKHKLYQDFKESKLDVPEEVFVTATDIPWKRHIDMQAAWQLFAHNGISKTINMPEGTTEQDVMDAYMYAYDSGLKGITVYIAGSRKKEALVSSGRSKKERVQDLEHKCPVERPDVLECDIHHTQVQGEKWVVFVGLFGGKPYEIFAGLSKYVDLPKKCVKGHIVKRPYKTRPSEYDLVINIDTEDELRVWNIVNTFENANHGVLGRLISLSLRHGCKPSFVSNQLSKDTDFDFTTYAKTMGRTLKKYIANGEKPETGVYCPQCENELVYQEGCKACLLCSWSKCD